MATRAASRKAVGPVLWVSRSHRLVATRTATSVPQRVILSIPVQRKYTTTRPLASQPLAPKIVRGESKLFASADEAVADLQSGSTVLSAGFGLCGVAETLIKAISRRSGDLHSLTAVSNNAGVANVGGLALLADAGQISRLIISFLGNNKTLEKNYLAGKIAIELCPQGTIAERVRAGGAGIPAFYTPTGVSTLLQEGQIPVRLSGEKDGVLEYGKQREVREFKGRKYLMEEAITGDVAILRAWKADETGNCVFRYTTKSFGPIMAKAATLTIVEAEEIVPVGSIDPNDVDLPGIFVDRIVPATAEKHIEIKKLRKPESTSAAQEESPEIVSRNRIAKRAAKELKKGYYVNLGVGIPTLAPSYLPKGHTVWVQSENGILGMGAYPTEDEVDPDIINAGKETVTLVPGASTFDSSESFGMIRGGHVDVSILGALQVAASGDLANYMIPGKVFKGMGGAMDLVSNPNNTKIVVATSHVAKDGTSKVVQKCSLPLTGANCVSTIITDLCVFEVDRAHGELTLTELAPGVEVAEVRAKTDADFHIADDLKAMESDKSPGRPHLRSDSGSAPRTRADPDRRQAERERAAKLASPGFTAICLCFPVWPLLPAFIRTTSSLLAAYIIVRRVSSTARNKSCLDARRCSLNLTAHAHPTITMAASDEKSAIPEDTFENAPTREALSQHEGTAVVRKILWKLDVQILPLLALLFLCSFLDRTNVGNAKIIGLEKDTGMSDNQYDIGLAVFYLFYVCSELPSNLVLKKASPKLWLPFLTIIWGIITMCLGFVHNYGSFVAVRALLGIAEGGLLPGMVLYLSSFYRRSDLAIRIGLFYTAASLSGAFGGLLARGLVEIGPRGGLEGWRWIFIIEGLLTVVCGVIAGIGLPNNIGTARYLSPQEREIANDRLLLDKPSLGDGTNSENESLKWSEVFRGLVDISMWLTAIAYFGILAGLYSFGLFLPTIIQGLGIVKTPNEVQLWSVIPYAVATVCTVFTAFLSDRLRLRGVIMLFSLPIAIIGYAVIGNVSNPHVQYGMTFLMAVGMYASVPCILVWNSNNSAGHYKRATTSGMQLAIANCGGFVSTFIYPSSDGPLFHRGHSVVLGLLCFSWFLILCNVLYCRKVNKDKASGKYNKYLGYNDDRDPKFIFIL